MIPVYFDNIESAPPLPIVEEICEASNSYRDLILTDYVAYNNGLVKTAPVNRLFKYSYESESDGVDIYAQRIEYFLDEFSRKNKIVNFLKISEVIYRNKTLLGMVERLIAEVTSVNSDKIDHITMRVLRSDEEVHEYVFLTFNMNELVSVRETIEIEDSFKLDAKGKTYEEGLTFAFV